MIVWKKQQNNEEVIMNYGAMSEGARWDIQLTEKDIALLADGAHPTTVCPENLVEYWPYDLPEQT